MTSPPFPPGPPFTPRPLILSKAWADLAAVISADQGLALTPLQFRFLRRAFYIGAETVLREIQFSVKGPAFTPEEARDRLNSLVLELQEFHSQLRKGKA